MSHPNFRPLILLTLASLGLSQVACMGDWDREPETPRNAWEDQYQYPGESTAVAPPPAAPVSYDDVDDTDPSAVATFQPVLSPYGTWVEDPTYGYVWVPYPSAVGPEFSPYLTNGHWAYTDEGQYWVSDYEWGWATFHYGRWVWVEGRGWAWIPGARYAPAWVEWRYGGGYVGWGPMYPRHCWRGGVAVWIDPYPVPFVFLPSHHFYHSHPSTVVAPPSSGPGLVAGTKPWTPGPSGGGGYVGAKPFVGPDPKAMGIAPSDVAKSKIPVPPKARPEGVKWTPAPSSKIAPIDKAAPVGKPGGYAKPSPGVTPGAGGKSVTLPGTGYAPPAAASPKYDASPGYPGKPFTPPPGGGYAPAPKAYSPPPSYSPPPTYSPPSGGYSPAPKTYSPPPSYGGGGGYAPAPKTYSPPPSYGGGGGYAPAPKTYSPPPSFGGGGGYSPAPKTYSPPPSFGGGGGFSPAPKTYSPPPSFGGGGGGGFKPKPGGITPVPKGK